MGESKRTRVTETRLRELISEAMRRPPGGCAECLPRELSPIKALGGGANWQLLSQQGPCAPGCAEQLLEVCRDLAGRYDVDWP